MPPALSARAIFASGLTLTVLGIAAAFVAAPIAFAITSNDGNSYATAATIAGLVSEITLTLGVMSRQVDLSRVFRTVLVC